MMTTNTIIPIWFARLLTIAGLSACLYMGLWGTHLNGISNGFYASLVKMRGTNQEELYIPGGPEPYTWEYTGFEKVDHQLRTLVGFFGGLLHGDGDGWALGIASKYLTLQFCAGWILLSLEGLRGGHAGRWLSWTGTMGFIFQNAAYTITVPIWLALHLFASPTAKTKSITSSAVGTDPVSTGILPLCVLIGFGIPTIAMGLPSPGVLSAPAHYAWIAIWQMFPVWQSLLLMILRPFVASSISRSSRVAASQRSAVNRVYRVVLGLAVVSQMTALAVSLIPESAIPKAPVGNRVSPWVLEMLREVNFRNVFLPTWPSNPPAVDPSSVEVIPTDWLAPLAVHFLQWDIYCGNLAVLIWAGCLYYLASSSSSRVSSVSLSNNNTKMTTTTTGFGDNVTILVKALGWFVLGGPVAAAAFLLWERDEAVYRRELAEGKKAE